MTENEYVKTLNICGTEVKLGLDDYGQCYFVEWEEDGKTRETGLGTYNSNYMEAIYYMFDPRYKELSKRGLFGELTEKDWLEYCRYHDMFDEEYKKDETR